MDFDERIFGAIEKLTTEIGTLKVMLAHVIENNKYEHDRVTRELEVAKAIHDRQDGETSTINKILKGNGVKGLIERVGDTETSIDNLKKDMDEKFAFVHKDIGEKFVGTRNSINAGIAAVVIGAIGTITTIVLARIMP